MGANQSQEKSSLLKNFQYLVVQDSGGGGRPQRKLMYFDYLNFLKYEIEHKAWTWKIYSDYVKQNGGTTDDDFFCGWKKIQKEIFERVKKELKGPNQHTYDWNKDAEPLIDIEKNKLGITPDCSSFTINPNTIDELKNPKYPALPGGSSGSGCPDLKTSKDIHVPLRRRALLVKEIDEYLQEINSEITSTETLKQAIEGQLNPQNHIRNTAVELKKKMIDGLGTEFSNLIKEKYINNHDAFCKEWQRTMEDYHTLFLREDIFEENETKGIQCRIKLIETKVGGKDNFQKEWSKYFKELVKELQTKTFTNPTTQEPCQMSSEYKTQCVRFFEEWAEEFCKLKKDLGDMMIENCKGDKSNVTTDECKNICNIYKKFLNETKPYFENYVTICTDPKYGGNSSTTVKELQDMLSAAAGRSTTECCKDNGNCTQQELFNISTDKGNIIYNCMCKEGTHTSKRDKKQECQKYVAQNTVKGRTLSASPHSNATQQSASCGSGKPRTPVKEIATTIQTTTHNDAKNGGKAGDDGKGELKSELSQAEFKGRIKLGNGDVCNLKKETHTNDKRDYSTNADGNNNHNGPCTGKGGDLKERFKIGRKWEPQKNDKVIPNHNGVLFPPRRLDMCSSNLENLNVDSGSPLLGNKAKHSFLGDVLLAAKIEAENIIELYKQNNGQSDNDGMCRAMKYSFADIGDIIRGRDIWTKESGNKQLQENLKAIFKKIKENTGLAGIYNEEPPYTELRNDWWALNRDQVWKAMTQCNGTNNICSDTSLRIMPPYDDYIPQKLRWLTEWTEWYCKAQKYEYAKLVGSCEQCKNISKGNTCPKCKDCQEKCTAYSEFIKEWKKQWTEMETKYQSLYKNAENGKGTDENEKYLNIFLHKLKESNKTNDPYTTAGGYVKQVLEKIECEGQKEFCDDTDDKYAFKEEPKEYNNACKCIDTPPPPPPPPSAPTIPCTGNKVIDTATDIQHKAASHLGTNGGDKLKGHADKGTYKHNNNGYTSELNDICKIDKQHSNDVRKLGTKVGDYNGPCTGKGTGTDTRFIIGDKWTSDPTNVRTGHTDVLLPPRRRHMCTSNLENLAKKDSTPDFINRTGASVNDSFLGDVLLAAKYEGEFISHKLYDDTSRICNAMKYSFADLGDIIRGRDLWSGNEDMKKIQDNLKAIFKKIHEQNGGGSTGKYPSDRETSNPPYKKLREDWWEANRKEIWKAMTCSAPVDADLSIPSSDPSTRKWQGPQCGRDDPNFVPVDDYIPQKLRWMTEWTESYCRQVKADYDSMMLYCWACKSLKKKNQHQGTNNEKEKSVCSMCSKLCKVYTDHVKEWQEQWNEQKDKYQKLYREATGGTISGGDPIKEKHEEFMKELKQNSCNKDGKDYPNLAGYVTSMGGNKYCKDAYQSKLDEGQNTEQGGAFEEKPHKYKTECEWTDKDPPQGYPRPPPAFPTGGQKEPCTIVNEIMDKKKQTSGSIDGCNQKYNPKIPNVKYPEWDCTNTEKQKLIQKEDQGACMPPRRQKLCLYYLKILSGNEKPEQLREAFIKTVAAETFLAWKYFIEHGEGKNSRDLLEKHLKEGTIPDVFKRQMIYTYGDLKDLCLNSDISKKEDTNGDVYKARTNIDNIFKNGKYGGKVDEVARKKWWDTNGPHIWQGMVCGLSHHIKGANKEALTDNVKYKYDSHDLKSEITKDLFYIEQTPQFLRWFTEWSEEFCKEQSKKYGELYKVCVKCKVKTDKTCDKNGKECNECQNECPEYKAFIGKWRKDYDKQKEKFDKDKTTSTYDEIPFVDKKKSAHENLDLALGILDLNSNCMEEKSKSTTSTDIPASLDETPDEFKDECVCTDPPPPPAPKCTHNKILDAANMKQHEVASKLVGNTDLVGNIEKAKFKNTGAPTLGKNDFCKLQIEKHTNDVRSYTSSSTPGSDQHNGPCTGKGKNQADTRFIIGQEWKEDPGKLRNGHDGVLLPPRRRHMCTSNLENIGRDNDIKEFLNTTSGASVNDSFLGDVLLAAKFEGEDIIEKHLSKSDKSGICNAMKYSFADLGDIIRGKDLWEKNEDMQNLETYLQKIFEKIQQNITDQATKDKYSDTSGKYTKLREAWWNANRDQVWRAMTCGAPETADLYIPSKDGTYKFERVSCGRESYIPPDDYIPQRLRWMTEWAESYCKQLERNYWWLMFNCTACKKSKAKSKGKDNEAQKAACSMCSSMCNVYKKHVTDWKQQWQTQEQEYKKLQQTNKGATSDDIKKQANEFLQKVNGTPDCKGANNDNTTYDNLATYVSSMGGGTYCNDTTQTKFDKDTSGGSNEDGVFEEHPKDYKKQCEDKMQTPTTPKTKPQGKDACIIVDEIMQTKDQGTGSIDFCNAKTFDNNSWKCDSNIKHGETNGACMPPRRQSLCINNLKDLKGGEEKEKLREAFIKCAAKETHLLWDNYKKNKTNNGNLDEELKKGNIPPEFLRSMFFTYADYRDLCLGKDIGDDDGKNIAGKVTSILKDKPSPEDWWDENGLDIWKGMLCGLSHHISDKMSRTNLTENDKYKYDSDNLTSGIAKYVLYTHTTPQFLRWFTEWADLFCLEQSKKYVELYKACMKCNVTRGKKTCENKDNCTECKAQCEKYTKFIEQWKVNYTTQKGKFDKDKKNKYDSVPFVETNTAAYTYLYEQLELLDLHGNCMKTKSTTQQGNDMPQSLDTYPPGDYKEKCDCKDDNTATSNSNSGFQDPRSSGTTCEDNLVIIKELNFGNNDLKICAHKHKGSLDGTVDGKGENFLAKKGSSRNNTENKPLLQIYNGFSFIKKSPSSPCGARSLNDKKWICEKNGNSTEYVPKEDKVCLPPRTQILCVGNLDVGTTHITKGNPPNINDVDNPEKLLTEVLIAAEYEGTNLRTNYYQNSAYNSQEDKDQILCSKVKYSFGDHADIIKGKKIYTISDKDKTENNLQTIFEKIYNGLGNEQSKYKDSDGKPDYTKLREAWWKDNRKYIWKILLHGAAPTNPPKCLEKFTSNPPTIDYIPQSLRWVTEWSEEFCNERKKLADQVVDKCNKCKDASEKYHETSDVDKNGNSGGKHCGDHKGNSDPECKDCKSACTACKDACTKYKEFVEGKALNHDKDNKWRELWKQMEEKYTELIGEAQKKLKTELEKQRKKQASQTSPSPQTPTDNIPPYMTKCGDNGKDQCLKPDEDSFYQYLTDSGHTTLSSYINSVSENIECGKDKPKWGNTVVINQTSGKSRSGDIYPQPFDDRPTGYKYACECRIPSRNELCDDNQLYRNRWECKNGGATTTNNYELCHDKMNNTNANTSSSQTTIPGTKMDEHDIKFFNLFDIWYKDIQNRLDQNIRRIKDQCDKDKIMAQTSGSSGSTQSVLCLGCRDSCECYKLWVNHMKTQWQTQKTNYQTFVTKQESKDAVDLNSFLFSSCWEDYLQKYNRSTDIEKLDADTDGDTIDVLIDRCGKEKKEAQRNFQKRIDKAEKEKNMCDKNQDRCKKSGMTLTCDGINGSVSGCNAKTYDNTNGKGKQWKCTDGDNLEKDVCVPPRTQVLCISNMNTGKIVIDNGDKVKWKTEIQKAMKKETENLYDYYNSKDHNKRAIISSDQTDPNDMPKNFCHAAHRTYNDFKHMVIGDVPWKNKRFLDIHKKIEEILQKPNKGIQSNVQTPKDWWNENEYEFWDSVKCGIKEKHNGGSGDECGPYPPDDADNQFVWWFKEWGQQFCIERQKYIKDINDKCDSSANNRCSGSGKSNELQGDCKTKCDDYKKFINKRKSEWNKQKNKYEREHPGTFAEELLGHYYPECVEANFENIFVNTTTTNSYSDASDICSCKQQTYACKGSVSTCKEKGGDLTTWRTGLLKKGKDNKILQGVYAPPRRQKLCLANLYPINFGKSTGNTGNDIDRKKNEIFNRLKIVAEREAYYLWLKHVPPSNKDDPSSHNRACCAIRSSFYDIGDIVKGTDLWDDQSKKYIDKTLNDLFKQELEEKTKKKKEIDPEQIKQARKQWWEYTYSNDMGTSVSKTIRDGVWDAMQCGVRNAITELQKQNTQVGDDQLPQCMKDKSGQRTFDLIPTPQFARWLVEWTHQFCKEYTEHISELGTKCKNSGSNNCSDSGGKNDCKTACTNYNDWINLKRKEWIGMSKYYSSIYRKNQYESPDSIDYTSISQPTAIKYLNQRCKENINGIGDCCHCKNVGTTSNTGSNSLDDMGKVVNKIDDKYAQYKPRCTNCQLKHIKDQIGKIEKKIKERQEKKKTHEAKPPAADAVKPEPTVEPPAGVVTPQAPGGKAQQPDTKSQQQPQPPGPPPQIPSNPVPRPQGPNTTGSSKTSQPAKTILKPDPYDKGTQRGGGTINTGINGTAQITVTPSKSPDTSPSGSGSGSGNTNVPQQGTASTSGNDWLDKIKEAFWTSVVVTGHLGAVGTLGAIAGAAKIATPIAEQAGPILYDTINTAITSFTSGVKDGLSRIKGKEPSAASPGIVKPLDGQTDPRTPNPPKPMPNPNPSHPGSGGSASGSGPGPGSHSRGGKAGKGQPKQTQSQTRGRSPRVTPELTLTDSLSLSAIPLSIGVAFAAIAYMFWKKKPKFSPVDLLRVIDIPQNDYGIPDKTSTNRYIPYGKYKGKTYIYVEGDESDDYSYIRDISSSDITSSESEYEEMDINDIYVPGRPPKYKTLIDVVLKPSRKTYDVQDDTSRYQKDDSYKLTDNEWNQLKHDFIAQYLQHIGPEVPFNNDLPNDNIPTDIHPNIIGANIKEKPFITQIQDRVLHGDHEITYNINWNIPKQKEVTSNFTDDPKYVSNNIYTGIDLINDSLNRNHNVDIYDELLKRKENELYKTNNVKSTSTLYDFGNMSNNYAH